MQPESGLVCDKRGGKADVQRFAASQHGNNNGLCRRKRSPVWRNAGMLISGDYGDRAGISEVIIRFLGRKIGKDRLKMVFDEPLSRFLHSRVCQRQQECRTQTRADEPAVAEAHAAVRRNGGGASCAV